MSALARNEVVYGAGFLHDVQKLQYEVQEKLAQLLDILVVDAFDPRLHTKPLGAPLKGVYSFRITRDWRVAFEFFGQHTIKLLVADHRNRIYKRLARR
ncbi:MAG: hypothetical protein HY430_04045 [Candidatus Levybacteria bacterium]|nr:hypothetical protein [Candidatus Levybacteria bacterium]